MKSDEADHLTRLCAVKRYRELPEAQGKLQEKGTTPDEKMRLPCIHAGRGALEVHLTK